jgi:hypothetical protein
VPPPLNILVSLKFLDGHTSINIIVCMEVSRRYVSYSVNFFTLQTKFIFLSFFFPLLISLIFSFFLVFNLFVHSSVSLFPSVFIFLFLSAFFHSFVYYHHTSAR